MTGTATWVVKVAGVALAYSVAGRLALLMAIPPGYATAVWPAAGLALAALLMLGPRVWPGVALGSFLVNVSTSFDASSTAALARSLAIPLGIGAGAALQGLTGFWLVRRFVGYPTPLDQERDVGRFLLLGGPAGCVVGATWGVATLVIARVVPPSQFAFSWWTWWVGDTIGVVVFAPLALAFGGEPRAVWRRRRLMVAVPVAVAFAVVTLFFLRASRWEQQRIDSELDRGAREVAHALDIHVEERIGDVFALASFHPSGDVSRQAFRSIAARLLSRHRGVRVLSWVPRVPAAERAAFEEAARREGRPGFAITETAADGSLVRAASRDEYFPVYYLEPYAGNEAALGFDLASEPARLEALVRSRDGGAVAVTAPIRLVQEPGAQHGFLVFAPVYAGGEPPATTEERRRQLRGFVTGAFRVGELVDEALRGVDVAGLRLQVEDERAPGGERPLYRSDPPGRESEDDARSVRAWSTTLEVAGRAWRLRIALTPEAAAAARSWQAWVVLAGGLALVGALGAILLVTTGREALVERRVAQRTREVAQANRDLARAQELAHLGSWRWSVGEDRVAWSEELYRIYGLAPGGWTATFEGYLERVHPEDRERVAGIVRQALADGRPFRFVERIVRPDGEVRVLDSEGQVIVEEDGRPREMVGVCQDVTERARVEGELETSRALYQGLFEDAPDALLVADTEGRLQRVSRQAEVVFGYAAGELIGLPVETLLPERFRESHAVYRAGFAAQPRRRAMGAGLELYGRRKDGVEFPVDVMLSPLGTGEVLAVVRDITDRKRFEAELKRSNEELERFAYVASHDLQEPLRMVASYTELLARRYRGRLDADADEFIRFAMDGANHMSQLINDLLAYSRVGSRPLDPGPADAEAALERALANLRLAVKETGAEVSHDPLPTVRVESGQLVQLLQNLIGNALKFHGPEPPRVHVSAALRDGSWLFSVRDNGIGIAPEHHQRIFLMFQRLHGRKEYRGTGAGLAICQRIVERHGGRIWVESSLGRGATFYFTLPAVDSSGVSTKR
jgi:PAS domain S-box-containing protein